MPVPADLPRGERVFLMPGFVRKEAIDAVRDEGHANMGKVFRSTKQHNVYLTLKDESFTDDHARNRLAPRGEAHDAT